MFFFNNIDITLLDLVVWSPYNADGCKYNSNKQFNKFSLILLIFKENIAEKLPKLILLFENEELFGPFNWILFKLAVLLILK